MPFPVADWCVAGELARVMQNIPVGGLPRRLGQNRLVAATAAVPLPRLRTKLNCHCMYGLGSSFEKLLVVSGHQQVVVD